MALDTPSKVLVSSPCPFALLVTSNIDRSSNVIPRCSPLSTGILMSKEPLKTDPSRRPPDNSLGVAPSMDTGHNFEDIRSIKHCMRSYSPHICSTCCCEQGMYKCASAAEYTLANPCRGPSENQNNTGETPCYPCMHILI